MSQSANVRSIQAIHDFKIDLANFAEDARNALTGVESEIRQTRNWLQRDQLSYWQAQVKRRTEDVSTARTELHRRKLSQQGSDAISDTEQKENLRAAQRRLEEAERKVALVKKWAPVLEHAISEYHSAAQPLGDRLTGALVSSMALLDRMVKSLESYLAVAPPVTPVVPDPRSGPAGPVGSSSASPTPAKAEGGEAGSPPQEAAEPAEAAVSDAAVVGSHPAAAEAGPEVGTPAEEARP
jgi:hypothetical protein